MTDTPRRQFVWDLPTRLFHWSLVVLIGFSWWSAEYRDIDWLHRSGMEWHRISGLIVCGLLIFRILWGLFGTSTARFTQFVKGPKAIWAYLRPAKDEAKVETLGHNPLGAISVVALLLLLLVQITSGLFATDEDMMESGPLSSFVNFDQSRVAAAIHHISFSLLQLLVLVHIIAILFYLFVKKRNLTGTMITGHQPATDKSGAAAKPGSRWLLLLAILLSAGLASWIGYGVPPFQ